MKPLIAVALMCTLGACSSYKIKGDIQTSYAKKEIPKTQFPPSQEKIEGKPATILVMDTKVETKLGKQAELKTIVSSKIESLLMKNKVDLADRSKAKELAKELQLAEVKGVSTYEGEQVADYVVIPNVTNVTFSRKYHEAYTSYDDKGKSYYHPARCVYESETTGYLDVYEMPALVATNRVEIKGYASKTTETRNSSCPYSKNDANALVVESSQHGIYKQKSVIKNIFAPTGYVIELRMNEKGDVIVKSTLGEKQGAIQKGKVFIKQKRAEVNGLTGKSDMIEVTVGEGVISDRIHGPFSWIVLDKKKTKLGEIKLGDAVILEYKDSIFDVMKNGINSTSQFLN